MTIISFWRNKNTIEKIVICVYIIAFFGATYNHIADIVKGGLFPYTNWWNVPMSMNIYWTVLTILDPIAIIILSINIYIGYWLYLLIMISDVCINIFAELVYWKQPIKQSSGLIMQIGFLLFLSLTGLKIIKSSKKKNKYSI